MQTSDHICRRLITLTFINFHLIYWIPLLEFFTGLFLFSRKTPRLMDNNGAIVPCLGVWADQALNHGIRHKETWHM